ncbi:3'5'-cyclic nucleotide phosphodiesterase [Carpediemonas membranifera]|uniref:Phosphodiesterase n=1 Tax=Carpediemonas membranifera TaxID=201153 RepID=A0A8J6AS06_9EUKA|nr:3'5'-cyclic nucleotide phosphodiesterase [Carpediemonas membranifera]|eukprot:KAG9390000.1 3'5'-cyclic nucleotide phosphodiesterase [Carpediemonas membranifera]
MGPSTKSNALRSYTDSKRLKRRMLEYERELEHFPKIVPTFVRVIIRKLSFGRLFTVSTNAVVAPVEPELIIGYLLLSIIPIAAQLIHVAPHIRWHAIIIYYAVSSLTLQFQFVLRSLNPLSPYPMFLTIIPFTILVFLSREVHQLSFIFNTMMIFLVYLQVNLRFLVFTLYSTTMGAVYLVTVLAMKFYYRDDSTSASFFGTSLEQPIHIPSEMFMAFSIIPALIFVAQLQRYIRWFGLYHRARETMLKLGITEFTRAKARHRTKALSTPLDEVQTKLQGMLKANLPEDVKSEMRKVIQRLRMARVSHGHVDFEEKAEDVKKFVLQALGQSAIFQSMSDNGTNPITTVPENSAKPHSLDIDGPGDFNLDEPEHPLGKNASWHALTPMGPATNLPDEMTDACPRLTMSQCNGCTLDGTRRFPLKEADIPANMAKWMGPLAGSLQPHVRAVHFAEESGVEDKLTVLVKSLESYNLNIFMVGSTFNGHAITVIVSTLFAMYDLYEDLLITPVRLVRILLDIEDQYTTTPYHNKVHAADVAASIHWLVKNLPPSYHSYISSFELAAVFLAAVLHDVGHPGADNRFQVQLQTPLAQYYNDESVLESYHASHGWKLLTRPGLDLFEKLCFSSVMVFRTTFTSLILSTDMGRHIEYQSRLRSAVEVESATSLTDIFQPDKDDQRHFLLQSLFKMADISNPTKDWPLCKRWALRMLKEFFDHGDMERSLGLPVSDLKDRETSAPAKSQLGFMRYVVIPYASALANCHGSYAILVQSAERNLEHWEGLVCDSGTEGLLAEIEALNVWAE